MTLKQIEKQNALAVAMNYFQQAVDHVDDGWGLDPENKARFMLEVRTAWNRLATLEGYKPVFDEV